MPMDTISNSRLSYPSSSSVGSSASSFLAGALTGLCAGAALALLYTPLRGSEARARVRQYASQGNQQLQRVISSGRSIANDAWHQTSALIEQGRGALRTSGSSVTSTVRPLTASVAERSGERRFQEPLGG